MSPVMPSNKRQRETRDSSPCSSSSSERARSESPVSVKKTRHIHDEDKENRNPPTYSDLSRKNTPDTPIGQSPDSHVTSVSQTPHRGCSGSLVSSSKGESCAYDYICFHRPLFDVDGENWRKWSEGKAERLEESDLYEKVYKLHYLEENKNGIFGASPAINKDHKWVIKRGAWLKYDGFCRRVKYVDADGFNRQLYIDWKGWGMQEIVDNTMVDFDEAARGEANGNLDEMWSIISAIGLWVNVEDISELLSSDDDEKTSDLVGLLGCALITVLNRIEHAGELQPKSRFLDLPLVIGYYLELSHHLPAYGIEGQCLRWRKEVALLFEKSQLENERCLFDTELRLKELKNDNVESSGSETESENDVEPKALHQENDTKDDPWAWSRTMDAYRKKYRNRIGLKQNVPI